MAKTKPERTMSTNINEIVRTALAEGKLRTDSDVEDFAEENNLPCGDVEKIIWTIIAENTPCAGCKHVVLMASGMYPCNACVRRAKDMYKADI